MANIGWSRHYDAFLMICLANFGRIANQTYLSWLFPNVYYHFDRRKYLPHFEFVFFFYYSAVLQKAFNSFDSQKTGSIPTEMVSDILRLMGQPFDKKILEELIEEVDEDSKLMQIYTFILENGSFTFVFFVISFELF